MELNLNPNQSPQSLTHPSPSTGKGRCNPHLQRRRILFRGRLRRILRRRCRPKHPTHRHHSSRCSSQRPKPRSPTRCSKGQKTSRPLKTRPRPRPTRRPAPLRQRSLRRRPPREPEPQRKIALATRQTHLGLGGPEAARQEGAGERHVAAVSARAGGDRGAAGAGAVSEASC